MNIENNMKNTLLIFLLALSFSGFAQSVGTNQLKDGAVTPIKLSAGVGRPVNMGVLATPVLTFDQLQKRFSVAVTSDIALSLASSGNVADSKIFITATGDGSHVLSFPTDWIVDVGETYNPNAVNEIELTYKGSFTQVSIVQPSTITFPILISAIMDVGTDDLILTFDNAVTITTAGWSVTASGGAVTIPSVVSGSGTTIIDFDLSRNIASGETMSISYDPSTGATVSLASVEIALISNFFVDTGVIDLPPNSITVDDSGGKNYTTITAGVNAAVSGQTVVVYSGTYRETVPGKNGVTVQPAPGETPIVSGLETVATSWTSHDLTGGKSIYKTTITLPVDNTAGYNLSISNSNTTLFNNQIFKGSAMQFEARYPNITTEADLLDQTKFKHRSQITTFNAGTIVDSGIPSTGLTGAKLVINGWFWNKMRTVTAQPNSTTLNFSGTGFGDTRYLKYYYVCGKLGLLDAAKEWYYDDATNTLYLWQTGGGSPTGIEYKARNWGFDLRGVDNMTIKGLTFIGCEVAHGDTNTDGCVIDNVRATYTNHDVMYEDIFPGYGNATETGLMLLGVSNVIKNSEFRYSASQGAWLGTSGIFQNNWVRDCDYDGSWGAPISFTGFSTVSGMPNNWGNASNVKILYNTFERTGRSCVDMGFSYTGNSTQPNLDIEVGYNDMSGWGSINIDLGAIYSWGWRNLTGSSYHHNWFHDDGVRKDPSGAKLDGGQRAVYFDQGSGPVTVHHNVFYNNFDDRSTEVPAAKMQDTDDIYSQMDFTGSPPTSYYRSSGGQSFYNNTVVSDWVDHSYRTYEDGNPKDVFRNNIFRKILNLNWTGGAAGGYNPDEQYNLFDVEITNNPIAVGTGTLKNQDFTTNFFSGAGSGGLVYRLHASNTLAINTGVVIANITTNASGVPDKGAYELGESWTPGYVAVTLDAAQIVENDNTTYNVYNVVGGTTFIPTTFSNSTFSGGSASFWSTTDQRVSITFTGTAFELWGEKSDNKGIAEVKVDGVRQDCDAVTGGTQDCDCYAATTANNSQLIFSKTGLSAGTHVVDVRVTGTKNVSNTSTPGTFYLHDKLVYTP